MKHEKILVTKSVRDEEELDINNNIDALIEKRTKLTEDLKNAGITLNLNKKRFKEQKKKYKLTKRQAKKVLKAKIKEAQVEYKKTVSSAFKPMKEAKDDFYDSKNDKRDIALDLFNVRSEIHSLQKYKILLAKKYISEDDEFIEPNKTSKR